MTALLTILRTGGTGYVGGHVGLGDPSTGSTGDVTLVRAVTRRYRVEAVVHHAASLSV